jgi:hypothetical protein
MYVPVFRTNGTANGPEEDGLSLFINEDIGAAVTVTIAAIICEWCNRKLNLLLWNTRTDFVY